MDVVVDPGNSNNSNSSIKNDHIFPAQPQNQSLLETRLFFDFVLMPIIKPDFKRNEHHPFSTSSSSSLEGSLIGTANAGNSLYSLPGTSNLNSKTLQSTVSSPLSITTAAVAAASGGSGSGNMSIHDGLEGKSSKKVRVHIFDVFERIMIRYGGYSNIHDWRQACKDLGLSHSTNSVESMRSYYEAYLLPIEGAIKIPTASEAAVIASLPIDNLSQLESKAFQDVAVGKHQIKRNYIEYRNHILHVWLRNPGKLISLNQDILLPIVQQIGDGLTKQMSQLLSRIFFFLDTAGYINWGVCSSTLMNISHPLSRDFWVSGETITRAMKLRIKPKMMWKRKKNISVVVVGAGLSGLLLAIQLLRFGYHVKVIEAKPFSGGRLQGWKISNDSSVIHFYRGALGDPFMILADQLKVLDSVHHHHKISKPCFHNGTLIPESSHKSAIEIIHSALRLISSTPELFFESDPYSDSYSPILRHALVGNDQTGSIRTVYNGFKIKPNLPFQQIGVSKSSLSPRDMQLGDNMKNPLIDYQSKRLREPCGDGTGCITFNEDNSKWLVYSYSHQGLQNLVGEFDTEQDALDAFNTIPQKRMKVENKGEDDSPLDIDKEFDIIRDRYNQLSEELLKIHPNNNILEQPQTMEERIRAQILEIEKYAQKIVVEIKNKTDNSELSILDDINGKPDKNITQTPSFMAVMKSAIESMNVKVDESIQLAIDAILKSFELSIGDLKKTNLINASANLASHHENDKEGSVCLRFTKSSVDQQSIDNDSSTSDKIDKDKHEHVTTRLLDHIKQHYPEEMFEIKFNHPVKKIEVHSAGVRIDVEQENNDNNTCNTNSFEADVAVVTVPLGCLKRGDIEFVPSLSDKKKGAISNLGFTIVNRVIVEFLDRKWMQFFPKSFMSIQGAKVKNYVTANILDDQSIMYLTCSGSEAEKIEEMTDEQANDWVCSILLPILSKASDDHDSYKSFKNSVKIRIQRWGSDSYSLGSASYFSVSSALQEASELAKSLHDCRLVFTGEATSTNRIGTAGGAIDAALRYASVEILSNFGRRFKEDCVLSVAAAAAHEMQELMSSNDDEYALDPAWLINADSAAGMLKQMKQFDHIENDEKFFSSSSSLGNLQCFSTRDGVMCPSILPYPALLCPKGASVSEKNRIPSVTSQLIEKEKIIFSLPDTLFSLSHSAETIIPAYVNSGFGSNKDKDSLIGYFPSQILASKASEIANRLPSHWSIEQTRSYIEKRFANDFWRIFQESPMTGSYTLNTIQQSKKPTLPQRLNFNTASIIPTSNYSQASQPSALMD